MAEATAAQPAAPPDRAQQWARTAIEQLGNSFWGEPAEPGATVEF